jgi:hypothetical protein
VDRVATAMHISSAVIADHVRAHRRREYEVLCLGIAVRVREGSLPPDDVKGWVIALVYDARRLDLIPSSLCDS